MGRREDHAQALRSMPLDAWDDYLRAGSGLPGPRADLELLAAVGDVAPAAYLWACASSDDEYRAACGAAGLGRLLADGDPGGAARLRVLAADPRWRVREGVAMALQRLGDADLGAAIGLATSWAHDPHPLVQRAAVAGLCEPRLLRSAVGAAAALRLVEHVTTALAALPPDGRRDPDVRVLRKALGYCWSVAVAADPDAGWPALESWAQHPDADVRWVVRENAGKNRLVRLDAGRAERLRTAAAH